MRASRFLSWVAQVHFEGGGWGVRWVGFFLEGEVGCESGGEGRKEGRGEGIMCFGFDRWADSTHVTLGNFHILDIPTFDHEVPGI